MPHSTKLPLLTSQSMCDLFASKTASRRAESSGSAIGTHGPQCGRRWTACLAASPRHVLPSIGYSSGAIPVYAPDSAVIAIARDDDTTFGILHSRFHEAWSLRLGTSLEDRPRYTPTTTFQTFPFPEGLTPDVPARDYASDPRAIAIAEAARRLVELRDRWLNPPEWVEWVDEPVPGYPRRPVPRDEAAAKELKTRTLTNLYNQRSQWLANAHAALDSAVATAYGWPADISDDDALGKLLELNLDRRIRDRSS